MGVPIPPRGSLLAGTLVASTLLGALGTGRPATAQEEADKPPEIAMAVPLAAAPGTTTRLVLRGWNLQSASAVRVSDEQVSVKLGEQGPAPVPGGQNAKEIGEEQIEIELELPADLEADVLSLRIVTESGQSKPYELLVGGKFPVQADQEPNNGFHEAQAGRIPQIVDGSIQSDRDVDVFALEGEAGQALVCEVLARRRGSSLDATLTLCDANRIPLAYSDDQDGLRDPRLQLSLPAAGRYYLVVADASDRGGPAHPYRLIVHGERSTTPSQP